MTAVVNAAKRWLRVLLDRADAWCNRLYGWRGNPLYQSGTIAVASFVVLLVTGIYLLLFYRIGSPYASVARVTDQVWVGRWIRGLHRYSSDLAVAAVVVHALRMFVQGRSWGPRALAWISGLLLLFVLWICGWTGYVMVWDVQAQLLAMEGARLLDALPVFAQAIGRAFVGEGEIPSAFFFLNLFLHIALPIGLAFMLWLHVSRVARPTLLPPRALLRASVLLPLAAAVLWPITMAPEADPFRLPSEVPVDLFYGFFLPITRNMPAAGVWIATGFLALVALAAPWWTRPRAEATPAPSVVNSRHCTGCNQCPVDCPYEAISMVPRDDDRPSLVALVDPSRCVSCGICAGSCAPMGVGPPTRTGRDQLEMARAFMADRAPAVGEIVVVACDRGSGGLGTGSSLDGATVYPVTCVGSLHTSAIELMVRSGVAGVMVVSCPPRDCWSREGPKWLEQRMYHDREAELQARVDRNRVKLVFAARAERGLVSAALNDFQRELEALDRTRPEQDPDITLECATAVATDGPTKVVVS